MLDRDWRLRGIPALSVHSLVLAWSLAPFPAAVLIISVLLSWWYLDGVAKVRRKHRKWENRRVAAFLLGLVFADYALAGPVGEYVMSSFVAHVIQHLTLMIVTPALLSMAAPVTLALQTLPGGGRRQLSRFLHSRLLHWVTFPVVVFALYYGVMWWFFTTSVIGFAMNRMWIMDLFNLLFFLGGVLFWWPLVGKDPILHWRMGFGARLATLVIGIPFESFLGLAISGTVTPPAPIYTPQQWYAGGQLLWGVGELLTTIAIAVVVGNWLASEERAAARMSRSSAAVPLSGRVDGTPKEYFWAKKVVARGATGTPIYREAMEVIARLEGGMAGNDGKSE